MRKTSAATRRFYHGRTVVVTGGASGIGRCLTAKLAMWGNRIVVIDRNPVALTAVIAELGAVARDQGGEILTICLDITDRATLHAELSRLEQTHPVDILINNAGITSTRSIGELGPEDFELINRVNYLGSVWATLAVLPGMRRRGRGHIGFVSSLAGKIGVYGYSAYSPTKFAVAGFAESLRCELAPERIGISVLFPPDTSTPLYDAELTTMPAETRAISGGMLLAPEVVATAFLSGIADGRFEIVPGFSGRLSAWGIRHFPGLTRWVVDRKVRMVRQNTPPVPFSS